MKHGNIAAAFAVSLFLLAGTARAEAEAVSQRLVGATPYRVTAWADWAGMTLSLRVELEVAKVGLRLPEGRLEAERMIDRDLAALLKDAAFSLTVDSFRTLGETIMDGSLEVDKLLSIAALAKRRDAVFSNDMKIFTTVYELPLLTASSLYVRHSTATPLGSSLDFRPTRPYTGIVIYAKGKLPVHGEGVEARLEPCFFPRVFDEDMNLLVERNAVSPEALRRWGETGYANTLSLGSESRVGESPLRIVASAIFGTYRTDLVITRGDALKILGLPENRALVEEGRILIVMDETTQ